MAYFTRFSVVLKFVSRLHHNHAVQITRYQPSRLSGNAIRITVSDRYTKRVYDPLTSRLLGIRLTFISPIHGWVIDIMQQPWTTAKTPCQGMLQALIKRMYKPGNSYKKVVFEGSLCPHAKHSNTSRKHFHVVFIMNRNR